MSAFSHRIFEASLFAIVAMAVPGIAHAQQRAVFDQPGQALGDALRTIGARGGVSIAFDPAIVRGKRAPAIKGSMSVSEALKRALAGSGLGSVLNQLAIEGEC